jgi:tetratricopeptide (TPR) repeat protein
MTCAFEGALDVYRTALTGIVPTDWNQDDLWQAHRSARSYSDRILLLNHLHARFQAFSGQELMERTLSNFILWGEWLGAAFYASGLSQTGDEYKLHKILLDTYASWEVLPRKENLGAFAQMIDQQRAQLQALPASPLQKVALGYMDFFANRPKDASAQAEKIESDDGLTLYWLTNLIKLSADKNSDMYSSALEKRLLSRELTVETRLYYLSRWLELLRTGSDPAPAVDKLKAKVGQDALISDLLEHEKQLYRVATAVNKESTRTEMRAIVDRIKRLKSDYYGMRLLFNRGMIVLYQAKKSRELATIMSLWLTYVNKDTKEYPFAIEALRQNSLDLAYRFYHSSKAEEKPFASGAFMDSIRTSDDLESHYQYALLHFDNWSELVSAYDSMQKDGLILGESRVFVELLRQILLQPDQVDKDDLEDATETLDQMRDDHIGVATRYLFQGYLYHRLMLLSEKDFTFDRDLSDKAHRSYLFAIDAAWNNDRIKAAALQNLGLLHSTIRNYSLAAEFYLRRHEMNYPNVEMKQAVLWLMARAMYRSYRFDEAYEAMDEALQTQVKNPLAFQEKAAFYAWNAQKYEVAADLYAKVMAGLGDKAKASLWLSQGYVLSKLKRWDVAEQSLQKALSLAQLEKPVRSDVINLVYQPIKVQFVALGLLARLELTITKRIDAVERRLAMFPLMIDQAKAMHFQPETLSAQRIKETQDLAAWRLEAGQKSEAIATLSEAMRLTEEHGRNFGHLAHTVFVSLKNLMLMVGNHQLEPDAIMLATLDKTMAAAQKEYADEKNPAAEVRAKWAEVQLIGLSFRLRQDPSPQKSFVDASQSILAQDSVQVLAKEKPAIYAGLQGYRDALARSLR